jgi:hypothetical protein
MQILSITVTNSNDPTCQRLKLTRHFEITDIVRPEPFIRECIKYTEDAFREIFPRGMTYTLPYTEAEVDVIGIANDEDRQLLKAAYSSGQLQGTIIGERIQKHFGVPYTDPSMDTRSEAPLLSESLGGHK